MQESAWIFLLIKSKNAYRIENSCAIHKCVGCWKWFIHFISSTAAVLFDLFTRASPTYFSRPDVRNTIGLFHFVYWRPRLFLFFFFKGGNCGRSRKKVIFKKRTAWEYINRECLTLERPSLCLITKFNSSFHDCHITSLVYSGLY